MDNLSAAARDVLEERKRQIEVEGFDFLQDDRYVSGELERAAGAYVLGSLGFEVRQYWPWRPSWFKTLGGRRRMLVKAGALILAAIERMDRESGRF